MLAAARDEDEDDAEEEEAAAAAGAAGAATPLPADGAGAAVPPPAPSALRRARRIASAVPAGATKKEKPEAERHAGVWAVLSNARKKVHVTQRRKSRRWRLAAKLGARREARS
jgi:hypothetical protein